MPRKTSITEEDYRLATRNLGTQQTKRLKKLRDEGAALKREISAAVTARISSYYIVNMFYSFFYPNEESLSQLREKLEENQKAQAILLGEKNTIPTTDTCLEILEKQIDAYTSSTNDIESSEFNFIKNKLLPFIQKLDYDNIYDFDKEWLDLCKHEVSGQIAKNIMAKINAIIPSYSLPESQIEPQIEISFAMEYVNLWLKKLGLGTYQPATKPKPEKNPSVKIETPAEISIKNNLLIKNALKNNKNPFSENIIAELGISQAMLTGLQTGLWYTTCQEIHEYQKHLDPTKTQTQNTSDFFQATQSKMNEHQQNIQQKLSPHLKLFNLHKSVLEVRERVRNIELTTAQIETLDNFEDLLKTIQIPTDGMIQVQELGCNKKNIKILKAMIPEIEQMGGGAITMLLEYACSSTSYEPPNRVMNRARVVDELIADITEQNKELGIIPNEQINLNM
jgi:hypothetical protein